MPTTYSSGCGLRNGRQCRQRSGKSVYPTWHCASIPVYLSLTRCLQLPPLLYILQVNPLALTKVLPLVMQAEGETMISEGELLTKLCGEHQSTSTWKTATIWEEVKAATLALFSEEHFSFISEERKKKLPKIPESTISKTLLKQGNNTH